MRRLSRTFSTTITWNGQESNLDEIYYKAIKMNTNTSSSEINIYTFTEQMKKKNITIFNEMPLIQFYKVEQVKWAIHKLDIKKRTIFKELVKYINNFKLPESIFDGILVNKPDRNSIRLLECVLKNPELFEDEGKFYPHFNNLGEVIAIPPLTALQCLFSKSLVSHEFTLSTLFIVREVISDKDLITMLNTELKNNNTENTLFIKDSIYQIANYWIEIYSKVMKRDDLQSLKNFLDVISTDEIHIDKEIKKGTKTIVDDKPKLIKGQSLMSLSIANQKLELSDASSNGSIQSPNPESETKGTELGTEDTLTSDESENKTDVTNETFSLTESQKQPKVRTDFYRFIDIKISKIAEQFFVYDIKLIKKLTMGEIILQEKSFTNYLSRINAIDRMVNSFIDKEKSPQVFSYFIKVARHCLKIGEYNISYIISCSLKNKSTTYKQAFEKNSALTKYKDLEEIFPLHNLEPYKEKFRKCKCAKIPIMQSHVYAYICRANDSKLKGIDDEKLLSTKFIKKLNSLSLPLMSIYTALRYILQYKPIESVQEYFERLNS
ncbi:hypothetical protein EHI8A_236810 [Entamoeba histolytica HM-1:IMSS-B]|uniref:Ras-GEF domain-containing protein n=6 Tax=Entamoeba histolytica TaxID=5759 RepID=C4M031_ENTH1|nr:hypothetical protein EHI_134820 [Entamoeba histolytica HM-1:IMSS]EMD47964.1 Hypothetical protein EHI5A_015730 [Entamoeba histolytica KU27]EMH74600.1 hypothetical protein EHI8A_236810 [Entamoeba histolytica HM-1:IMSS-B]EMS14376.1 hypothetical protein KM1_016970 [Entamoeba histolytica HM-3:IMSS]ENY61439.1 hypothetical protein EHI7A_197110 [Entamoeba histolytica HM-1:IMSS-A]EAL46746.2 hypothetical protein EHI_134820 [Entamoeba histolytica HM-1:IMSS]|eukprot:XP_652132.2 hypothetical protein EHI_134820 [Entamoeba histolytica HM-1:IMSS]